ncbi:MAG: malto-oligosyltrehalose synthase, partial [Cyanobacteria bacterium J06632_3]
MRKPTATYRIQFNDSFNFAHAKQIVDYLSQLGISDIYASPIFKARSGSQHGYDVVDQTQINPELGGRSGFDRLSDRLQEKDIGWLQDIVPNHMAFSAQNEYLMDVFAYGPRSEYANLFDIEWNHASADMHNKVLAPVLGSAYGECLERGEIQLEYTEKGLFVGYYSFKAPIFIGSYPDVLGHNLADLKQHGQQDSYEKLSSLLSKVSDEISGLESTALREWADEVKRSLWSLYNFDETVKAHIDKTISLFNGVSNDADSYDLLDELLLAQHYRLCYWKVSSEELNYRRFFTVNELISVRVEQPVVFEETHALIKSLIEAGRFSGLRIDHIDGLYDPMTYLSRLREKLSGEEAGGVYTIVEKILESGEKLPTNWPLQGTSGYEFLVCVNQLFCASEHEVAFTDIYHDFVEAELDYEALVLEKKQLLAETNFVGDIDNLARALKKIAVRHRYSRDLTLPRLRKALQAVMVCFPIYCTYIDSKGVSERDAAYVREAVGEARSHISGFDAEFDFIERVFLLQYGDKADAEAQAQWLHFVMKVQQYTGPLMAKGLEDTLFYIYNRFIGLNEVGSSPHQFGISASDFHAYHQYKQQHWPHMLNTTSTHDTKRSEDVRARLNVISELPDAWREQVQTWRQLNAEHVTYDEGQRRLDPNDEYFLYQTLVGAYPFDESVNKQALPDFKERVKAYVVKAVREAKVNSDWSDVDDAYEGAYVGLVDKLLTPSSENVFLETLKAFCQQVMPYGIYNSLAQLLIKLTVPGAADIYQG